MTGALPTMTELLARWELEKPEALALLLPHADGVREITWREFAADVRRVATAWQAWGLRSGDHAAQLAGNCYEWILNDLAFLQLGAVHVVISEKTAPIIAAEQLLSTTLRVVVCRTSQQGEELQRLQPTLSELPWIVYEESKAGSLNFVAWQPWLEQYGSSAHAELLPQVAAQLPATIVFTSGTTGEPRGVVLSQQSLVSNAMAIAAAFADEPTGRRLCWLPLTHLFARTADFYCWLVRGSEFALLERPEDVISAAQRTQPEFMNVVPYFLDKLRRHVSSAAATQPERAAVLQQLLGGKIRLLIAGGAALADSTRAFYAEHGVTAVQGYGLTEAGPVVATETLTQHRHGSVGRALPGVEVQIADTGEILVRSPSMMHGYWRNPVLTQTKIGDGWLHTGDMGRMDDDGFLYVEGRHDDVLVLSTGCKVSPAAIEAALLEEPLIQQILIVGQGRNHLAALIVPNPDVLRSEIIQRSISVMSREQALVHPAVLDLYRTLIAERLQHFAPQEQLRQFALIGRGWTVESGEMTASLKLKRRQIEQNFAAEIEKLYVGN